MAICFLLKDQVVFVFIIIITTVRSIDLNQLLSTIKQDSSNSIEANLFISNIYKYKSDLEWIERLGKRYRANKITPDSVQTSGFTNRITRNALHYPKHNIIKSNFDKSRKKYSTLALEPYYSGGTHSLRNKRALVNIPKYFNIDNGRSGLVRRKFKRKRRSDESKNEKTVINIAHEKQLQKETQNGAEEHDILGLKNIGSNLEEECGPVVNDVKCADLDTPKDSSYNTDSFSDQPVTGDISEENVFQNLTNSNPSKQLDKDKEKCPKPNEDIEHQTKPNISLNDFHLDNQSTLNSNTNDVNENSNTNLDSNLDQDNPFKDLPNINPSSESTQNSEACLDAMPNQKNEEVNLWSVHTKTDSSVKDLNQDSRINLNGQSKEIVWTPQTKPNNITSSLSNEKCEQKPIWPVHTKTDPSFKEIDKINEANQNAMPKNEIMQNNVRPVQKKIDTSAMKFDVGSKTNLETKSNSVKLDSSEKSANTLNRKREPLISASEIDKNSPQSKLNNVVTKLEKDNYQRDVSNHVQASNVIPNLHKTAPNNNLEASNSDSNNFPITRIRPFFNSDVPNHLIQYQNKNTRESTKHTHPVFNPEAPRSMIHSKDFPSSKESEGIYFNDIAELEDIHKPSLPKDIETYVADEGPPYLTHLEPKLDSAIKFDFKPQKSMEDKAAEKGMTEAEMRRAENEAHKLMAVDTEFHERNEPESVKINLENATILEKKKSVAIDDNLINTLHDDPNFNQNNGKLQDSSRESKEDILVNNKQNLNLEPTLEHHFKGRSLKYYFDSLLDHAKTLKESSKISSENNNDGLNVYHKEPKNSQIFGEENNAFNSRSLKNYEDSDTDIENKVVEGLDYENGIFKPLQKSVKDNMKKLKDVFGIGDEKNYNEEIKDIYPFGYKKEYSPDFDYIEPVQIHKSRPYFRKKAKQNDWNNPLPIVLLNKRNSKVHVNKRKQEPCDTNDPCSENDNDDDNDCYLKRVKSLKLKNKRSKCFEVNTTPKPTPLPNTPILVDSDDLSDDDDYLSEICDDTTTIKVKSKEKAPASSSDNANISNANKGKTSTATLTTIECEPITTKPTTKRTTSAPTTTATTTTTTKRTTTTTTTQPTTTTTTTTTTEPTTTTTTTTTEPTTTTTTTEPTTTTTTTEPTTTTTTEATTTTTEPTTTTTTTEPTTTTTEPTTTTTEPTTTTTTTEPTTTTTTTEPTTTTTEPTTTTTKPTTTTHKTTIKSTTHKHTTEHITHKTTTHAHTPPPSTTTAKITAKTTPASTTSPEKHREDINVEDITECNISPKPENQDEPEVETIDKKLHPENTENAPQKRAATSSTTQQNIKGTNAPEANECIEISTGTTTPSECLPPTSPTFTGPSKKTLCEPECDEYTPRPLPRRNFHNSKRYITSQNQNLRKFNRHGKRNVYDSLRNQKKYVRKTIHPKYYGSYLDHLGRSPDSTVNRKLRNNHYFQQSNPRFKRNRFSTGRSHENPYSKRSHNLFRKPATKAKEKLMPLMRYNYKRQHQKPRKYHNSFKFRTFENNGAGNNFKPFKIPKPISKHLNGLNIRSVNSDLAKNVDESSLVEKKQLVRSDNDQNCGESNELASNIVDNIFDAVNKDEELRKNIGCGLKKDLIPNKLPTADSSKNVDKTAQLNCVIDELKESITKIINEGSPSNGNCQPLDAESENFLKCLTDNSPANTLPGTLKSEDDSIPEQDTYLFEKGKLKDKSSNDYLPAPSQESGKTNEVSVSNVPDEFSDPQKTMEDISCKKDIVKGLMRQYNHLAKRDQEKLCDAYTYLHQQNILLDSIKREVRRRSMRSHSFFIPQMQRNHFLNPSSDQHMVWAQDDTARSSSILVKRALADRRKRGVDKKFHNFDRKINKLEGIMSLPSDGLEKSLIFHFDSK